MVLKVSSTNNECPYAALLILSVMLCLYVFFVHSLISHLSCVCVVVLCLLINALITDDIYNGLVIHGLCELETLPESVMKLEPLWQTTAYSVGGQVLSLPDIMHGILRGE